MHLGMSLSKDQFQVTISHQRYWGNRRAAMSDTFADPAVYTWNELTSELCPETPEHGRRSPEQLGGNGKKARIQRRH